MAILDNTKNNFVVDRDETKFVGLRLPLVLDNGSTALTKTTIEAVKQNIVNLCSTELGERVMQPNLGVKLKKFLFEPFNENIIVQIQDAIDDNMSFWMPFIQLNDIRVQMSDSEQSTLEVFIDFSLKKDPQTNESVQVTISGRGE